MGITALAASQTNTVQRASGAHRGGASMRKAFDAAADALGMSATDLRSALKSGQTMSALAQSKGVSTDTLKSAITSALQSGGSSMTSDKASQLAQNMIDGTRAASGHRPGGSHRPEGPPPGPPPAASPPRGQADSAVSAVASALGTNQVKSGTGLTDVAKAGGLTADSWAKLKSVVDSKYSQYSSGTGSEASATSTFA